jgi:thiol:disulfide interchange protein DsbC
MNNRCVLLTVAALVAAWPVLAPAEDDTADELERVREKAVATFNEVKAEDVRPSPVPGWYTVRKGTIVAYMSGDGRYLLQGELIDIDNEINLTEETRNEARLAMLATLSDANTIVFSPEEVKYSVSVFTDVDCTYCRRFHSEIDGYLAQGIEVRYLLYPRNGPESESWATAERVWCAADRNEALTLAKLDRPFESRECDASIVHDHYALGQDVGLRGTPALVLDDGTLISGYVPPVELSERMAAALAD